ncbi:MAG: DNA-directed RNA polymerase III subunit RPC1 [Vezdaea aestivalis]|nr:MAG: DNA-directed RNA polymerase III subunit RPC1 [Vezdaea aestivalis]
MQQSSSGDFGKDQVISLVPKRIREIEFGILSDQDIAKLSVADINSRELYTTDAERAVVKDGPLDLRLGTSRTRVDCETCGQQLQSCNGHFGSIRLALPVFHVGYFTKTLSILQEICKKCSRILLTEPERREKLRSLRRPGLDSLGRSKIMKKLNEQCRKARSCPWCEEVNGVVKKGPGALKILHDKFRAFNSSTAVKKQPPPSKIEFDLSFAEAKSTNAEIEKHMKKAMDDMNPLRVLHLFQRITPLDAELLGMDASEGRPEMFLWTTLPVPPACIRPSVVQGASSTEDELTQKLGDVIHMNNQIRLSIQNGAPITTLMEQWDYLQIQAAMYINSTVPGLPPAGKQIRGFCQRLKGKTGRFRGNLSGKRVDFSGRTVISPDPNLGVDEVVIPLLVAMDLTYPEVATMHNMNKLKFRVSNGMKRWPGAKYVTKENGIKLFLKFGRSDKIAEQLKEGDVVERHLEDGDIVLFNRQPSLHKLSILCHRVKVRKDKTFKLNECVCNPYNADFDGDEMNVHVPQTEEARAEALELMGVKHNLATPKNGEPIIAAIQDFISGSFLLTSKDKFYDRKAFVNMCLAMVSGEAPLTLPPPAILKPEALWTGKQVFNVLMRPHVSSPVLVNLDAASRQYIPVAGQPPDLDINDGWMVIRNSEIMCGRIDKAAIGQGPKDSVLNVILRDYGADETVKAMSRLSKLASRWLTDNGLSIGMRDVLPGESLVRMKEATMLAAYTSCDEIISLFRSGKLEREAGCNEEQTMEVKISSLLTTVRSETGKLCISNLSKNNTTLIMASCGSKGSAINVAQMVALVGQQIIASERVPDGFQDRSLPHFPKSSRQPPSKGFVGNSFYSGVNPTEFFFHAISGREGLVDTAVKTAETGYMSRRLIKSLEDLSTQYDNTVRNSSAGIVQFSYGDDRLDPVDMEAKAKPVHFERAFSQAGSLTWSHEEAGLTKKEILSKTSALIELERAKLKRFALDGTPLAYNDTTYQGTDQFESAREFLDSITDFLSTKADLTERILRRYPASLALSTRRKKARPSKSAPLTTIGSGVDKIGKITPRMLNSFVSTCLHKYKRAQVEPGHAVGAVGAQSIGEPGTQMTLKTFHFAGVAGMSITQGVPRIKEIINSSKTISTPIITCALDPEFAFSPAQARIIKARIEKTTIADIALYIEDNWDLDGELYLAIKLDMPTISRLKLDLTTLSIRTTIAAHKKLKIPPEAISTTPDALYIDIAQLSGTLTSSGTTAARKTTISSASDPVSRYYTIQHLKTHLPNLLVSGCPDANRVIIRTDASSPSAPTSLLIEGYGLRECMGTAGVTGTRTTTNNVLETRAVLGIEAARSTIVSEMNAVMADMDIDPRHMQLLADVMTYKGEVLGITRFGLAKMRDSVLQLASFEKTPDHLFDAAFYAKKDRIEGVSECIIMGQSMGVGTGAFGVARPLGRDEVFQVIGRKKCVFEEAWARRERE